jgi:hypothetical protein
LSNKISFTLTNHRLNRFSMFKLVEIIKMIISNALFILNFNPQRTNSD